MFLMNEEETAPLAWSSDKIKRALSLQETVSHAIFLRAILAEIMGYKEHEIPIISYVDSNNLFVEDKRLRLDIAQVQESIKLEALEV